jgi:predicted nucleic acid-binding protein
MTLKQIVSGTKVFIDANIFIYHFTGVSDECSDFLNRCERGDIFGITSANVLLEVLHRLMMIEAIRKKIVRPPNIVKKLKKIQRKINN